MQPYILFLLVATTGGFAIYTYDKLCAATNMWRVPEVQLLGLSLAGCAAGGLAAMLIFRHKTTKPLFYIVQIVGIMLHAGILMRTLSSR